MKTTFSFLYSLNNWSPLDQFENTNWTLFNSVFESSGLYSLYTFELEYDMFTLWARNGNTVSYFAQGSTITFLFVMVALYYVSKYPLIKDFSILFLLGFLHLATISVFYFWFDDFVATSFVGASDSFDLYQAFTSSEVNNFSFLGEVKPHFLPQINLAFVFDEQFVTFLAGFFLLGGAEEEDDENFILEEEESDFIEDITAPIFLANLSKDVEDNGALFLKLNTLFAFVLFNNLIGLVPYADTATSSLILTFWVSLAIFGSLLYLMFRKHGVAYFFSLFIPSGAPFALLFLLIPIEFISYTFRVVSLSVRLFANMFAGHALLKVILGFSWSMVLIGDFFLILNLFPLIILFILTFLEISVAVIQAYIFVTLTAIYLKDIFVAH